MNPALWSRERKIAALIFILVGSVIGLAFGFLADGDGHSFKFWVRLRTASAGGVISWGGLPWGVVGAVVAGALVYATVLFREKK